MTMGSAKIQHAPSIAWDGSPPPYFAARNSRDRPHGAMIKLAFSIRHRGVKIERPSRSDKLFHMCEPNPFDRLEQKLVPNGIRAAAQKPFSAARNQRVLVLFKSQILARNQRIQK